MNQFESAKLSPLPVMTTAACGLPYGLTWEDLRPIMRGFDETQDAGAQAFISHEKQGLNGGPNSCILTLNYTDSSHQRRTTTVFIKACEMPEKAEAQKYQALSAQGVPMPSLLATVYKPGVEIIVLEFLPTIGIAFDSIDEVSDLLHLIAQLNAIQSLPMRLSDSQREEAAIFDARVMATLTTLAQDQTLPVAVDAGCWFDAYLTAQEACATMPLAVNHGQIGFQQIGWAPRGATRQLVLFDLETMEVCPRFTDIANILYPLAIYTGRDQKTLFKIYFDQLTQRMPIDIDIDGAFRELRLQRVTGSCYSLPWLVFEVGQSDALDLRGSLLMMLQCMSEDLQALGFI